MFRKYKVILILLPIILGLTASPATCFASATPQPASSRNELLHTVSAAFRTGDLAGARTSINEYLRLLPDDGAMLYNLACVEARLGAEDAAIDALDRSLTAGWCDVERIATDEDLDPLRDREDFDRLLKKTRERLAAIASDAGETLDEGHWSRSRTLHANNGAPTDKLMPEVEVRLRYNQSCLRINAIVAVDRITHQPQPWIYGDAIIVDVVVPPPDGGFESRRHFSFAFGVEDGMPTGFFLNRHSEPVQRRIMDLAPKIKFHPGDKSASYSIIIPWTAVAPYAPPIDSELGINILYTSVCSDGLRRVCSLVPAPEYLPAAGTPRRYALFPFAQSEESMPVLRGRANNTIIGAHPLELNLCSWSPESGPGTLEVRILDMSDESLVESGPAKQGIKLAGATQRWIRLADLSALPSGPYRAEARLTPPSGASLLWSCNLLRLNEGWLEAIAENLQTAPSVEYPLLEMQRSAIETALTRHDPRDDPADLSRAVVELSVLARRVTILGSALPDSGVITAAWPGRDGQPQPVALSVPTSFNHNIPKGQSFQNQLLLVFSGDQTNQEDFARRIAIALGNKQTLAILIPQPPANDSRRSDQVLSDAAACLDWWHKYLQAETILIAGFDLGATDAIRFSLQRPDLCSGGVLLATGDAFNPWPGRDEEGVRRFLATTPNRISYHLINFDADGQGTMVTAAMLATGFDLETSAAPDGPCSLSQAPGLIARWLTTAQ